MPFEFADRSWKPSCDRDMTLYRYDWSWSGAFQAGVAELALGGIAAGTPLLNRAHQRSAFPRRDGSVTISPISALDVIGAVSHYIGCETCVIAVTSDRCKRGRWIVASLNFPIDLYILQVHGGIGHVIRRDEEVREFIAGYTIRPSDFEAINGDIHLCVCVYRAGPDLE